MAGILAAKGTHMNENIFEKLHDDYKINTDIKGEILNVNFLKLNHTCGFSFATPKPVSLDTAKPLRTHDVIVSGDLLCTCACPDELYIVRTFLN